MRQIGNPISFQRLRATFLTMMALVTLCAMPAAAASSKYAAIVMDARTGKVLHAENADSRRYPASLTKMMTLYLTFEALSKGKIKKSTPVRFSAQAATQPPTKIGVKAGGSITVDTAIYALVTRSANDASMALAELLGGSQQGFARMMTSKARALGMNNTLFRNPHGLPDPGQFTTARDMARLGIALREHYPQYYGYFSVKSFKYGRTRIANHNRLLGKIRGVDGIKTGYTRASGFNLVSSVTDGNRRLVAVVMGGTSARARDARMAELIAANMDRTSTRGGALIARADDGGGSAVSRLAGLILPKRKAPTPEAKPEPEEPMLEAEGDQQDDDAAEDVQVAESEADVRELEAAQAPAPIEVKRVKSTKVAVTEQAYAMPEARPQAEIDPVKTASTNVDGWVVQVGSSPSQAEAKKALSRAAERGPQVLASAEGFTVQFEKSGVTYYRARFGGFSSQAAATKACSALKRKKVECYATLN
ncbi:MAG: SPOR domain-containing protein [Rhizobiaceae bacterium]